MPSIVTITFSPCVDKSTTVADLIHEKKLNCTLPVVEPGGGGINVARAIIKLGGHATAIFPSGGCTGNVLKRLMQEENVPSVTVEALNESRENFTVLDVGTNKQYRFGMPGTALSEKEWMSCLEALREIKDAAFVVVSGSLPPGVPPAIFTELANIVAKSQAKLVVDTSGAALTMAAETGVYLLKPNLGELASLASRKIVTVNEAPLVAQEIITAGHSEVIIVSMGANGALLVTKDYVEKIMPPPVQIRSTVGAGDSMVAGIVLYLSRGRNLQDAARYGVACGTAATLNPGTKLCSREDADKLYTTLTAGSPENTRSASNQS